MMSARKFWGRAGSLIGRGKLVSHPDEGCNLAPLLRKSAGIPPREGGGTPRPRGEVRGRPGRAAIARMSLANLRVASASGRGAPGLDGSCCAPGSGGLEATRPPPPTPSTSPRRTAGTGRAPPPRRPSAASWPGCRASGASSPARSARKAPVHLPEGERVLRALAPGSSPREIPLGAARGATCQADSRTIRYRTRGRAGRRRPVPPFRRARSSRLRGRAAADRGSEGIERRGPTAPSPSAPRRRRSGAPAPPCNPPGRRASGRWPGTGCRRRP